jgi:hypothetical protein
MIQVGVSEAIRTMNTAGIAIQKAAKRAYLG